MCVSERTRLLDGRCYIGGSDWVNDEEDMFAVMKIESADLSDIGLRVCGGQVQEMQESLLAGSQPFRQKSEIP